MIEGPGASPPGEEPRLGMGGGEDHDGVDHEPHLAGEGSLAEGVRPMGRPDLHGPFPGRSPGRRRRSAGSAEGNPRGTLQPSDRHQRRRSAPHSVRKRYVRGNVVAKQADVTLYADRIDANTPRGGASSTGRGRGTTSGSPRRAGRRVPRGPSSTTSSSGSSSPKARRSGRGRTR